MFLSPWMLYGLGAASVPLIIHLWRRQRLVQIPFSTLRFLKIIAARTKRTSKIENLLLLVLRCALFVLLTLAAARPIIVARTGRVLGAQPPRTIVLIIDDSASMGWHNAETTRLDLAKANALALLDDLKLGDRVAVIAAGDRPELLIAEPTIDHTFARKAVEAIQQTETRGDDVAALREARKIAERAEHGIRDVILFSDSQATAWQSVFRNPGSVFDDAWKQADLHLAVVRCDDLNANNAAIGKVAIATPLLVTGAVVRGVATVENFSTTALHDLVEIDIDGERVAQRPVDAQPGGTVDVPFEFPSPSASGRWARGVAKLSGDALPIDDKFYFVLPVYQQPHVLVVEGGQPGQDRQHGGFFIGKALNAHSDQPERLRSQVPIPVQRLDDTPIESYSAVILADPGRLSDRSLGRLERFLDGGGTVAVFPGNETSIDDLAHIGFLPAKPTGLRTLEAGRQPSHMIDPAHPLFANAWDSNTPFPAVPQQKMLDWKLGRDAKVLLSVGATGAQGIPSTGIPFVIAGARGTGRVFIINASPDRAWGDFPLSPAFLPLVQQIARLSAAQIGQRLDFSVGEPIPFPATLPIDRPLRLTKPDGSTDELHPAGQDPRLLARATRAGIYTVDAGGGQSHAMFAVNVDRAESDLHPADAAALEKLGQNSSPVAQLVGTEAMKQWLGQSRGIVPLWPWILTAALLVFVAEALLANRMARRRSQGDEDQIKTGRLNRQVRFRGAQ